MTETPNLALPLIAAAQAQKHVTHNEALRALDAIVQCAISDRDLSVPPGSPGEGRRYIVAPSPSGAWAGKAGQVAAWQDGVWTFYAPAAGFLAYLVDEARLLVHDGSAWTDATPAALQNLTRLGIGTGADAANPFSAKLNAALWTARPAAEGGTGDLRYTLNKEAPGKTLSFLFQSGYSGRAEIGLAGDDDLQVKVSASGSAWTEALRVKADGKVGIGTSAPAERLTVAGNIAPATDNASSLGTATRRVSTVYAATGTINTSDIRRKTDVAPLDPVLALSLLRATPPISFRWRVGGLLPGEGGADPVERPGRRLHLGWSAQDWSGALHEARLDAGLLVSLDPADAEAELGLRPDQIVAVLHAAVLGLAAETAALRARLDASVEA